VEPSWEFAAVLKSRLFFVERLPFSSYCEQENIRAQNPASCTSLLRQEFDQAAELLRYATATYMVHGMLSSGRTVKYVAEDGEEIPAVPVSDMTQRGSAITATTDTIAEEGGAEDGRGELLVP